MLLIKRFLLSFLFMIGSSACFSQDFERMIDSIKNTYSAAVTLEAKAKEAGKLSQVYMSIDPAQSDIWGKKALEDAELSRNRKAMAQANLDNGIRLSYIAGKKEFINKAIGFFEKAYSIARANKLYDEMASSLLWLSQMHRMVPDADKAISYATQAFSIVSNTGKDSLQAAAYLAFGSCYLLKDDKLLALKNYFDATAIAERTKNNYLLRTCYDRLSNFYRTVDNYDKSLDYAFKIIDVSKLIPDDDMKYARVSDLKNIADIYLGKKSYELAATFYERAIKAADSIKFEPLKFPAYIGLLNLYLFSDEPLKALEFFNKNTELKSYITKYGMGSIIDQSYGYIYGSLNQVDSANYYFSKALPFYQNQVGNIGKINFFSQYGSFLIKSGNLPLGLEMLLICNAAATEAKNLNAMSQAAKNLDSAYQKAGDYKQALYYSNLHSFYKDSINKLGKEDEILQLQIADEESRAERTAAAEKERIEKRNRIQYLAIIIAIAVVFVGLVLLGFLRVSATTIRVIGFFAFLMFFEFIFLVFKKSIYGITEGEPWKDLAMMILIAAVLVPLHHWMEHKLIHYLSSHHMLRLRNSSRAWAKGLFKKEASQSEEPH
jgi:tetratricopeptide (TPR) repeat protein